MTNLLLMSLNQLDRWISRSEDEPLCADISDLTNTVHIDDGNRAEVEASL